LKSPTFSEVNEDDDSIIELQYLTEASVLKQGYGFGELALMHRSNKSFKRAATAISKGETHTAILSKEDF